MRYIQLLCVPALLAGCAPAPTPAVADARAAATLRELTEGRVAGPPITCLMGRRADNMQTIDESTIAFRSGSTVYINRLSGACPSLGRGGYALVTRSPTSNLCSGEIATVLDTSTGSIVGSCGLGDFVPYTRP